MRSEATSAPSSLVVHEVASRGLDPAWDLDPARDPDPAWDPDPQCGPGGEGDTPRRRGPPST